MTCKKSKEGGNNQFDSLGYSRWQAAVAAGQTRLGFDEWFASGEHCKLVYLPALLSLPCSPIRFYKRYGRANFFEGWLLSNDSAGLLRIVKLDDPASSSDDVDPLGFDRPKFTYDEAAAAYVRQVAAAGGRMHRDAQAIHDANIPPTKLVQVRVVSRECEGWLAVEAFDGVTAVAKAKHVCAREAISSSNAAVVWAGDAPPECTVLVFEDTRPLRCGGCDLPDLGKFI